MEGSRGPRGHISFLLALSGGFSSEVEGCGPGKTAEGYEAESGGDQKGTMEY